ncbi:hypothetical protein CK203_011439 [Vitis vinifera]|uniref:Integrase zinc-binding domain-containing protein n=1 Tax=Vitis vinifera TaxID=29760 RepID=A0A438JYM6_VITVI|nr:hypothetical protein CK203_011439 [Vitis vinifera]
MGDQRCSIPLPLTQGTETHLLRQQGIGRRRNQILKMELTALALRSAAQKLRPYFQAHPSDHPTNTTNQVNKNGGLCELTEPHAHQALELGSYAVPNWGTFGASHPGWDSLPLTMKQNMRPSCPDWTSPLLYPSPNFGSTATHNSCNSPNGQSKKSSEPTMGALTPWPKFPLATPLRQIKRTIKNGRITSHNISGQALCPEIQTSTQNPGTSCPFHPDWGHLYKRSFTGPYLRCLGHSEAQYVVAELHEGICENHSGGRSLAHRAHSQGYYWPTMKKTQQQYWGMDIVGPLPAAPAQKKFLLVATDYFSKWVEAEAYASIKDKDVTKSHKQDLINALKKRLEQAKGKWVEELLGVLWAYRTTPGRPTGNTPFALAYGMDAVIPTEIGLPTIRTDAAKQDNASAELWRNLDWADEVRENAAIWMADYQQRASAHYNRKVRPEASKMVR